MSRCEMGSEPVVAHHVFTLSDKEKSSREFILQYSPVSDAYLRPINEESSSIRKTSGWQKLVHSSEKIVKKHESDWKMVYLARTGKNFYDRKILFFRTS